jgi:hypothetical protein
MARRTIRDDGEWGAFEKADARQQLEGFNAEVHLGGDCGGRQVRPALQGLAFLLLRGVYGIINPTLCL